MNKQTCIHYTGIQHDCCRAGVNYEALTGGKPSGWGLMLPCWTSTMPSQAKVEKVACDKFLAPTDVQIQQDRAETDAMLARIAVVMPVVNEWRKLPREGRANAIACPTGCGGQLQLAQSSYNGHVHGYCSTDGCVRWME